MTKYYPTLVLALLLGLTGCGRETSTTVVTIDGQAIAARTFWAGVDSLAFARAGELERRQLIMEFAGRWLSAGQAEQYSPRRDSLLRQVETRRNDFILQQVLSSYITPRALSDSAVEQVLTAKQKQVQVREILFPHAFSHGFIVDRSPAEARRTAWEAYDRITRGELRFRDAVSIYTVIPYMELRQGDLGFISYRDLPLNLLDSIWAGEVDELVEPLETRFGYHLILVGISMAVEIEDVEAARRKIRRDIARGRHGVIENDMDRLSARLVTEKQAALLGDSLYVLWRDLALPAGSKHVPFKILENQDTTQVIGRIGSRNLTLGWFLRQSRVQANIYTAPLQRGFQFYRNFQDILKRHILMGWALETGRVDPERLARHTARSRLEIMSAQYLAEQLQKDRNLTREAILNRLLMEHRIRINERFVNPG